MKRLKLSILAAAAALPAATIMLANAAGPELVSNGDFADGVKGWANAGGDPQPFFGGMVVTNDYAGHGNSYRGATQCITDITPGAKYILSGDALVPEDAPMFGSADLVVYFFDNDDCSGPVIGAADDSGGVKNAERGHTLHLSATATAPANATAARVRATAQKQPKSPATSAPGTLIVAWDNISLKKQTIVAGPAIPDLPIKNLEPGGDPPVDPDPETPVDEPEQPADEPETPADEPTDTGDAEQPAETGDSDATTPAPGSSSDGPNSDGGQTSNTPGNGSTNQSLGGQQANAPATTAPLPPETGQGTGGSARGPVILGGSLAAMLAGLGLVAVAVRSRRKTEPANE